MPVLDAGTLSTVSSQNQLAPCEGPKAVAVPLDFTQGSPIRLDYRNTELLRRFSTLQGLYIDNAINGSSVSVVFGVTNQRITCPANSQGYFPVLCGNPISMVFSSDGNVFINAQLLNFPVAPGVWKV